MQKAFVAACGSLGKKVDLTGIVEQTDDASGSLLLATGTRVLLPDGQQGNDIAVGRSVRITGRRGQGGQVFAVTLTALDEATFKPLALKPCTSLLIAPVQPFGKPNPILHDPKGYEAQLKPAESALSGTVRTVRTQDARCAYAIRVAGKRLTDDQLARLASGQVSKRGLARELAIPESTLRKRLKTPRVREPSRRDRARRHRGTAAAQEADHEGSRS